MFFNVEIQLEEQDWMIRCFAYQCCLQSYLTYNIQDFIIIKIWEKNCTVMQTLLFEGLYYEKYVQQKVGPVQKSFCCKHGSIAAMIGCEMDTKLCGYVQNK